MIELSTEDIHIIEQFFSVFEHLSRADRALIMNFLISGNDIANRAEQPDFYDSDEWRRLRYEALKRNNGCCQCCGRRASLDNPLHVDHIKPRSLYPVLALARGNLQVLCADCNKGKSNIDQTDWRS
jgi:5-methylcytosine-specific restriction endonuclease McrA